MTLFIYRRIDYIDGRIAAVRAAAAIIEDHYFPGIRVAFRYPIDIVLAVQFFIVYQASIIGLWIAPAVQDVAAFAGIPSFRGWPLPVSVL